MDRWLPMLIVVTMLFVGFLFIKRKRYVQPLTQEDAWLSERLATYAPSAVPRAAPRPALPGSVPSPSASLASYPRNPSLTLATYQRLIKRALKNRTSKATLLIPPEYYQALLASFAEEVESGILLYNDEQEVNDDSFLEILICCQTTGPHRAIRFP